MATIRQLLEVKADMYKLRDKVGELEIESVSLKSANATLITELKAATQALSAIRILTREENGIAEAVHTLACNWKNFQES